MPVLQITPDIAVDEAEIEIDFVQAAGPGGQNVNKVATAVMLRFDAARSPSLPEEVRRRLLTIAGQRVTDDGVLILRARAERTQVQNRQAVLTQFCELVRRAAVPVKTRHKTHVPASTRRQRRKAKGRRSALKQMRRSPGPDE